jgi:FkbM family methyltransferase
VRSFLARLGRGLKRVLRDPGHLRASALTWYARKVRKKPLPLRDRNGFKYLVLPEEPIYTLLRRGYLGTAEIGEQDFAKSVLRPGMTVIDVGAHIGQFTLLFASRVRPGGRVISFEPCSDTVRRLRTHVDINGFSDTVTIERLAVKDTHGEISRLNIFPPGYTTWNTIGDPEMYSRETPRQRLLPVSTEDVTAVTLDSYCREHDIARIDYLKIDVEGAERDAISGASDLLRQHAVGHLQFEVSMDMIRGMKRESGEVFDLLNGFGYRCHPLTEQGTLLDPVRDTCENFANFIAMPSGARPT